MGFNKKDSYNMENLKKTEFFKQIMGKKSEESLINEDFLTFIDSIQDKIVHKEPEEPEELEETSDELEIFEAKKLNEDPKNRISRLNRAIKKIKTNK